MSTEITKTQNPFGGNAVEPNGKATAATMVSRASAEIQAAVFMAKNFGIGVPATDGG